MLRDYADIADILGVQDLEEALNITMLPHNMIIIPDTLQEEVLGALHETHVAVE